jgi:hypothetical protein
VQTALMDSKTVLQDADGKTFPAILVMQQVRLKEPNIAVLKSSFFSFIWTSFILS